MQIYGFWKSELSNSFVVIFHIFQHVRSEPIKFTDVIFRVLKQWKNSQGFFYYFGILDFKVFCAEKTLNNEKDNSFIHHNFLKHSQKKNNLPKGNFKNLGMQVLKVLKHWKKINQIKVLTSAPRFWNTEKSYPLRMQTGKKLNTEKRSM